MKQKKIREITKEHIDTYLPPVFAEYKIWNIVKNTS